MGQAEVVVAVVHGQWLVETLFALAQGGDTSADHRPMLTDGEVEAVTVDGGIAPSTSASKPCVPLLRHTAPQ
jgi:hypothetical protein